MKAALAWAIALLGANSLYAQEKVTFTSVRQKAGTTLYLFGPSIMRQVVLDSGVVKEGGKVQFTLPKGSVRGVYKIGTKREQPTELVLGAGERATLTEEGGMGKGSKEQDAFRALKDIEAAGSRAFNLLQSQYNRIAQEGMTPPEQVKITAQYRKRSDSVYQVQDAALAKLAATYKGTHAAKIAAYLVPAANEQDKTYFPGRAADVADAELAWPNVIQQKMVVWLQRYLPQDLETWERASLEAIDRAPAGSLFQENLFGVTVMIFAGMDQEFLRPVASQWLKRYPNNTQAKELLAQLPPPQPQVGDEAPEIVLKDTAGRDVPLSSLRGKVVLLDFWASWCGPCRQENPNVVRTYGQYKDKGFTVYSVSLDRDRTAWINAIKKDQLAWPSHVSDLKFWQSAGAQLYRVNSIPATFLLDKSGKIVAKNLRGSKLEQELQKLLN